MTSGTKRPALKPLFVPVLTKPSGDRYAAFAVYQVLQEWQSSDFAVAPAPVEAYDDTGELKAIDVIAQEIETAVQAASLSHPHEAVVFYTGHALVTHLKDLSAKKFATTHVHPLELAHELTGGHYDGQNWNHHSLRHAFGLDMLACPAHMAEYHKAGERATAILDDPDVLWVFGVSSQRVPHDPDLSADDVFATAHAQPLFIVSLPTPDAATDKAMIDLLVRLIHHEENLGERTIVIVDNPRSGHLLGTLLDALGKEYPVIGQMGAFAARVLPAVKKHPQSKIFLPGDSASVMTECIETLPWHHIIVNATVVKDEEQRKLVPFFFDHGCIQVLNEAGKIVKPEKPADASGHAAYDVAAAAIDRFVTKKEAPFARPSFMTRTQKV